MASEELPWEDDAVVVDRSDVRNVSEDVLSADREEAIRAWLQPTSYGAANSECSKHQASHVAGTGDWLWQTPSYTEWHASDEHGMLLIKGIPGSGKSVIAGSLVDRLSKEGVPVLYFFFRQIIDANHTPVALLRDWLDQILVYSPLLQAQLDKYLEKKQTLASKSINDLWKDVKLALAHLPKVYCVVDALDEIDDGNDEFLKALGEFGRWRPAHVKVVATSRPIPRVELPIRQIPMLQLRLEESIVDIDIATYVKHQLQHSSIPKAQHEEIKNVVPGRANGLFLYAKLAMQAFLKPGADIRYVIETLPADLNVLFTDLLQQHILRSGVPEHLQLLILSWVTHASRPLRLLELAEMINKTQDTDLSGLKAMKELVRTSCGPLLEILPDETVSVIHHSLTEFLNGSTRSPETRVLSTAGSTSYPILDQGSTHSRLARVCISYILGSRCLDGLKTQKVKHEHSGANADDVISILDDCDFKNLGGGHKFKLGGSWIGDLPATPELRSQYPFLAYCLDNWHVHVRKADAHMQLSEDLLRDVDGLLTDKNCLALEALDRGTARGWRPIHMASCYGLSQYVARIITRGDANVDLDDRFGEKPLLHAACNGHAATVKVLLAAGAKPDQPSFRDGLKPLHRAATSNSAETVNLILQAGADPMTKKTTEDPDWYPVGPGTTGYTPLMMAFLNGHEESARAFIPHLRTKKHVYRALGWAAEGGHYSLVEGMLKHPLANINAKIRGETPLIHAAKRFDCKIMLLLLDAGADPSLTVDPYDRWYDEFEDYDSDDEEDFEGDDDDSEIAGQGGFNALHALCGAMNRSWSARARHDTADPRLMEETISKILASGVDVNAICSSSPYDSGGSPLTIATAHRPALVRTLLKAGADATTRHGDGSTVLHSCLNPDLIQLLVEEGDADLILAEDSQGRTPLLRASGSGKMTAALARKFAELGADMTHTDSKGQTALHNFFWGHFYGFKGEQVLEVTKALLAAGVPANAKNHRGVSVLHCISGLQSLKSCYENVARMVVSALLAAGADMDIRDSEGKTPLFRLVNDGFTPERVQVAQMLVDLGANVNILDFRGRNLYFHRPGRDSEAMIERLLAWGVDPKAADYDGNPMDWALAPPGYTNNAGQSYVHILAANDEWKLKKQLLTFENFDAKDNAGIRPLHHLVKKDEQLTAMALDAGACPFGRTYKGMSPLQVAAAFRQPNIVGRLLEIIKIKKGEKFLEAHVNYSYRDSLTQTYMPSALQFACQARMPETVSLLLDAGADPNQAFSSSVPRLWCEIPFDRTGYDFLPGAHVERGLVSATNIWNRRNSSGQVSYKDNMPRIEPIMDLLYSHGARSIKGIDYMITSCSGDDYATECLLKLRRSISHMEKVDIFEYDQRISLSGPLSALELYADELLKYGKGHPDSEDDSESEDQLRNSLPYESLAGVYRRASARRAYIRTQSNMSYDHLTLDGLWDLILYKAQSDPEPLKADHYRSSVVSKLIEWGLVSIVRVLVDPQLMQELDAKHEQRLLNSMLSFDSNDHGASSSKSKPLLLWACSRSIDNLPMLRLLVEDLGANVNIQDIAVTGSGENKRYSKGIGALHELASSRHWWATAHGLPYLIRHGAEVDLRDWRGRTPLMCATTRAAMFLLDSGADVNAQGEVGDNCLTHSVKNLEMVKLLLSQGASVQAEVFHCLLKESEIDQDTPLILDTLLDGIDVNARTSSTCMWPYADEKEVLVEKQESYALYLAAAPNPMCLRPGNRREYSKTQVLERNVPVIDVLLKHGADLYAKYLKRTKPVLDGTERGFEEVTLLHDLLESGGLVESLLHHQDLDLERRDKKGQTLLLAACRSELGPDAPLDAVSIRFLGNLHTTRKIEPDLANGKPTLIQFLTNKGACMTARDHDQKNALHHILQARTTGGLDSISLLMSQAPELAHQIDSVGASPLLYALQRLASPDASDTRPIKILLDAGVDPHIEDIQGNNALHMLGARLAGHGWLEEEILQIHDLFHRFIKLGVPINGRNNRGETPAFSFILRQGTDFGHKYTAEEDTKRQQAALDIFAAAGAHMSTLDVEGNTLLHVVAATAETLQGDQAGEVMVQRFQWLVNQGLDAMAENAQLQTCLDVATVNGNEAILKLYERKE